MALKPGTEVACSAVSLNTSSVNQASMATAAAYATAAQSVRPMLYATAADAMYQLETQRIWLQRIAQPSDQMPLLVPTAAQIITCPQVQELESLATATSLAAATSTTTQPGGLMSKEIANAMMSLLPDQYDISYTMLHCV
jgi:hypothetical protein